MSLDESFYNCLINFTNSANEIREEAERNFKELVTSNNSEDVLTSLLNIIDKNPQSNVSFSALIQIRYYSFAFVANQLLDNEYLNYFRNAILEIYINPKFPINMRRYITHMIGIFFIFSLNPVNHSWPEIYDFLDKTLRIPELYADIIEFYINFMPLSDSFDYYDEERVQFIFSHLGKECGQRDRSYSSVFFVKYWNKYSSQLSPLIDFLSILNELDGKYFRYLASSLIEGIFKETIQLDPQTFYDILFSRIVDDNNDELFRQYCLNNLVYIICQNKNFYQIFSSNLSNFMEMMYFTTNDPHTYPILYDESITSLENMKYSIPNSPMLHNLLYTMVKNTNPFVSSLFQRYLLLPDFYQNGILFASQEDPYIRENGIYYLRKLVKNQTKELYLISNKVLEDIATCLLESYTKFNDLSAIRALSKWCYSVNSETLSIFADSICELCTNVITFETIECGAKLLHLKEKDNSTENDEFALFLLSNVNKILSSDYQIPPNSIASLTNLVNCLPQITHFVSMEKKIEFMNFLVPIICEDKDALFSKGLSVLFIQLNENVNLFDKQILSSLFLVYTESLNTSDSSSISNFLTAVSSYGKFFTIFETDYLQLFMQICLNIINEEKTFTHYSIPDAIRALGKMLSYYKENEELYNALFDFPFHYIYEDDEIDDIKYYLKIIYRLTQSVFFNEERASLVFDNFKKIFDHCLKSIVKAKEDENCLHFTITYTISTISEFLYSIFLSLFEQFPDETCQIIITNYLDFPSDFPLEMQTTIVSIYFEILSNSNDDFFKEIGVKLIKNLYDILAMLPSGQEEHLEMIKQLSHDDVNIFYRFQKIIITGFGNLFYQKKESIAAESIDQIVKTILSILPLKDDNDFNRELNDLQDHCISCMSKLIVSFKLNEKQLNADDIGLITLIFNWLPNTVYIDDLTFDCYFKILLFCISENAFEDSQTIDEMTNLLCKCIQEKNVSDRVLRTIYKNYSESNLNEKVLPLLAEIEKFLSVQ